MSSSSTTAWEKLILICFFVLISLYGGVRLLTDLRFAYVNQEHSVSENLSKVEGLFYLRDAQLSTDLGAGAARYQVQVTRTEGYESDEIDRYYMEDRWVVVFALTESESSETNVLAWLALPAASESKVESIRSRAVEGKLWHETALVRSNYKRPMLRFDELETRWLRRSLNKLFDTNRDRKRLRKVASASSSAAADLCRTVISNGGRCSPRVPVLYLGRGYETVLGLGFASWMTILVGGMAFSWSSKRRRKETMGPRSVSPKERLSADLVDEYYVVLYVTGYVDSLINTLSESTILNLNSEVSHSLGEDLLGLHRELEREVLRYDNLHALGISDYRSILDEAGECAREAVCDSLYTAIQALSEYITEQTPIGPDLQTSMALLTAPSGRLTELAQRLLGYLDDPEYQAQLDDFVP